MKNGLFITSSYSSDTNSWVTEPQYYLQHESNREIIKHPGSSATRVCGLPVLFTKYTRAHRLGHQLSERPNRLLNSAKSITRVSSMKPVWIKSRKSARFPGLWMTSGTSPPNVQHSCCSIMRNPTLSIFLKSLRLWTKLWTSWTIILTSAYANT